MTDAPAAHELAPPIGVDVLVVAPSVADALIGCGGTLAHHLAAGDAVVFVPSVEPPEAAARALAVLGGALGDTVEALAGLVANAGRIYCPSPLDPDPVRAALAVRLAALARAVEQTPELWLFEVRGPHAPDRWVDVGAVFGLKAQALAQCSAPRDVRDPAALAAALSGMRCATLPAEVTAAEAFVRLRPESLGGSPDALARWGLLFPPPAPQAGQRVSVIVRTRDRHELLADALACLALQTWSDLEVVVVDSGETSAADVASAVAGRLDIRHLAVAPGTSRGGALNAGLSAATGALITYLDDDDRVFPDHIEALASAIGDDRHVSYVDCFTLPEQLQPDGTYRPLERQLAFSRDFSRDALLVANYIPIHCLMHTRAVLDEVGGFDEALTGYEDWDLWIRLSARVPFHRVGRTTSEYRIRQAPWGRQTTEPTTDEAGALEVIRERYAAERAAALEPAYAELVRLAVSYHEALEPLRLELEQLRARLHGERGE